MTGPTDYRVEAARQIQKRIDCTWEKALLLVDDLTEDVISLDFIDALERRKQLLASEEERRNMINPGEGDRYMVTWRDALGVCHTTEMEVIKADDKTGVSTLTARPPYDTF